MQGKKKIVSYEDLDVYQKADRFVIDIYKITNNFPRDEQFALTSQIRRAAVSVPANIVEGFTRKHIKEYIHFLQIALGSLAEVNYYLKLSKKLEYTSNNDADNLINDSSEISKMLQGLIKALRARY